jgi:hypothetical protein
MHLYLSGKQLSFMMVMMTQGHQHHHCHHWQNTTFWAIALLELQGLAQKPSQMSGSTSASVPGKVHSLEHYGCMGYAVWLVATNILRAHAVSVF